MNIHLISNYYMDNMNIHLISNYYMDNMNIHLIQRKIVGPFKTLKFYKLTQLFWAPSFGHYEPLKISADNLKLITLNFFYFCLFDGV
jgi:hypothetical protein